MGRLATVSLRALFVRIARESGRRPRALGWIIPHCPTTPCNRPSIGRRSSPVPKGPTGAAPYSGTIARKWRSTWSRGAMWYRLHMCRHGSRAAVEQTRTSSNANRGYRCPA